MILGHTLALDPTVKQKRALQRACGVARFSFNWGLAEWNRQYQAGEKPSVMKLKKQFNALKGERFPWIYESPRDANAGAFADLGSAWGNYFAGLKKQRKGRPPGRPRFRKRGEHDAFYVANDKFRFHADGTRVHLPVIGSVRLHEALRLPGRIVSGRVRQVAGRWYLSVQAEGEFRVPNVPKHPIVGIDLGLKAAVATSHGEAIEAPRPLRAALRQLRRANRKLHRRVKGSANRHRARMQVARLHQRVACVRQDFLHKVTTRIVRESQAVVIEDLNVQGMIRGSLARTASDIGLGGLRRMLEYKGAIYGCEVIVADRWHPSSKRCSTCGNVKAELSLGQWVYTCEECGTVLDRDLNAALNLETYPGLPGNGREATPVDMSTAARRPSGRRASAVAEAGTNTVSAL